MHLIVFMGTNELDHLLLILLQKSGFVRKDIFIKNYQTPALVLLHSGSREIMVKK